MNRKMMEETLYRVRRLELKRAMSGQELQDHRLLYASKSGREWWSIENCCPQCHPIPSVLLHNSIVP